MQKNILLVLCICLSNIYLQSSAPSSVCFTVPQTPYWQNIPLDDASKKRVLNHILLTIGHPGLYARRKKPSYSESICLRIVDTHQRIAKFYGPAVAAACQYPEEQEYQAVLLWKDDNSTKNEISLVISEQKFKELQTKD